MSVQTRNIEAIQQFHNLPNEAGVRLPTACSLLACSPATIWRLAQAGKIKACKVSSRVTVFNVGSIRAALAGEC
jgi:predicted DNA-binding transcriptional regulator AlpA